MHAILCPTTADGNTALEQFKVVWGLWSFSQDFLKICTMASQSVLRIPFKFYKELQYRFWPNQCQINMRLYWDWYIFVNREPTRFSVFMKTDSTYWDKDKLSFEFFANQFSFHFLRKTEKNSRNDSIKYDWKNRRGNTVWREVTSSLKRMISTEIGRR